MQIFKGIKKHKHLKYQQCNGSITKDLMPPQFWRKTKYNDKNKQSKLIISIENSMEWNFFSFKLANNMKAE